jgi:hypothetical protein
MYIVHHYFLAYLNKKVGTIRSAYHFYSSLIFLYPPQRSCRGVYWFHHVRPSVRPSDRPSVDKSYVVREERRIPFIFDDFHFFRSRIIGHDMTENRIFTRCRMITWVVFLRMFWNFISSLPVKRGGSLSFLVGTLSNVLIMEFRLDRCGERGVYLSELCSL